MILLCPNYLHSDVSNERDLSLHEQEVTNGLFTMSLVPGTVDSDVALEYHLQVCCPSIYRVLGKRRGFSSGAAARYSLSARTNVFPKIHFFPKISG